MPSQKLRGLVELSSRRASTPSQRQPDYGLNSKCHQGDDEPEHRNRGRSHHEDVARHTEASCSEPKVPSAEFGTKRLISRKILKRQRHKRERVGRHQSRGFLHSVIDVSAESRGTEAPVLRYELQWKPRDDGEERFQ